LTGREEALGQPGPLLLREFFAGPSQEVGPALLGCVLESRSPDGVVAVALTEVEAYAGAADPASHAYRGLTERTAVMFGEPGHAYVYFTYGMHFCVNLVCLPEGTASAVLLRAGRIVTGAGLARQRRTTARRASGEVAAALAERDLARGPARLCQALGIGRSLNGADVCDSSSVLTIHAASGALPALSGTVLTGPRVGVSSAASVPWRFWLDGEPTVSPYRAHVPRRR
jgi:DNA-3-methyladenine glycosylase